VTVPTSLEPRLDKGAVDDDEAEDEDCQCRNWPDHWAVIDPRTLELHPLNECGQAIERGVGQGVDFDTPDKILGART
jgi:hypothetical protein